MKNTLKILGFELKNIIKNTSFLTMTNIIVIFILLLFSIPTFTKYLNLNNDIETANIIYEERTIFNIPKSKFYIVNKSVDKEYLKILLGVKDNVFVNSEDELIADINAGKIKNGFVIESPVKFKFIKKSNDVSFANNVFFKSCLKKYNMDKNLLNAGIDPILVDKATEIKIEHSTHNIETKDKNIFKAYGALLIFVIFATYYGNSLAVFISKEKEEKTSELLLTTSTSSGLVLGKVLAYGIAGILQMLIISVFGYLGFILNKGNYSEKLLNNFNLNFNTYHLLWLLIFGAIIYFTIIFIYSCFGSLSSKYQDGGFYISFFTIFFIMIFILGIYSIKYFDKEIFETFSFLPFSGAVLMPLRIILKQISVTQLYISLMISLFTLLIFIFVSIKIYKFGILNSDKKYGFFKGMFLSLKK